MENKVEKRIGIEQALRYLPERKVPEDLQKRIMMSLPQERKSWFQRLSIGWNDLFRDHPRSLSAAVSMACLLLVFYGGIQFGQWLQIPTLSSTEPLTMGETMNAETSFFLGRSLLAAGEPERALVAFRRAEQLRPENPEYLFWQAASYYSLGDIAEERQSYLQLIKRSPQFFPARLNLAHNLLQEGLFSQAEQLYKEVLEYDPLEKTALYNQGIILHLQQKKDAEGAAWRRYLSHYRTGTMAFRALQHLHDLGDYSFRGYQLGYRTIILNQQSLLQESGNDRAEEIRYLSTQFARQPGRELNLIVFNQNGVEQAKRIALTLRGEITSQLPTENKKKVRISWFGEAESLETVNRAPLRLPEGILVFSTPRNIKKGEKI